MNETYLKVSNLIELRRYDQAREELDIAFQETPDSPLLFHLSANLFWIASELDKGIEAAQAGLSIDPDSEFLRYDLFTLLNASQKYSEAEKIIIKLIEENPRDTDYLHSYSSLMLCTFHLEKARVLINEALRIAPNNQNSHLIGVLIDIAQGNLNDSEQRLTQLMDDSPENERILHLLVVQLIKKNKYSAALQLSKELLRANPYDQDLIDSIIELKAESHWTAWPKWPTQKFGWVASIGIWFGFVLLSKLYSQVQTSWLKYVLVSYGVWCIYTWVHAPVMNRWFKYKGV